MLDIAKKLSEGAIFLHVDLYNVNEQIYFSELTFYPCAAFTPFKNTTDDDLEIGKFMTLSLRWSEVV